MMVFLKIPKIPQKYKRWLDYLPLDSESTYYDNPVMPLPRPSPKPTPPPLHSPLEEILRHYYLDWNNLLPYTVFVVTDTFVHQILPLNRLRG